MSRNGTARIAGVLYILLVICGLLYLVYIPSLLIDWNDASLTFLNIERSQGLFKMEILVAIASFLIFILLPLVLFKLLHSINKNAAYLMVLFAWISVPISFVNILNKFAVLDIIEKAERTKMTLEVTGHNVMFHLEQYAHGLEILQIFWGIWLLPFGYLVYKSGFLPKIFGLLLMAGCFGYLTTFLGAFLYEGFSSTILANIASLPAALGEIGIAFWLLIMGTGKFSFKRAKRSI